MKPRKSPFILLRLAGLTVLLLSCCLLGSCSDRAQQSFARKGIIDLSHWDFQNNGTASLAGEWQFAQGQLLDPQQLSLSETSPDYLQLPRVWQGTTTRGKPLSPIGCGTYRLRVQLPPDTQEPFSLLTTGALSVCKIFINGKALAASGTPACTKNEERPRDHFTIARFPAAPSLELVIQVSNHHNTQGGLGGWIMLGTAQDVQGHMRFLWLSGALVSGALLCMSLYHFALFFLRRSFKANLYFGLFCFFWSMATGFSPTSGFLMAAMGLKLNWGLYVTLATLPFGLTTPMLLLFYQTLFPKQYGKAVTGIFAVLGALYISYILVTPPNAYDPVLFGYFLLTRVAYVYIFAMFILDALRREHGVLWLVPGYLGLAYAELDDILFDLNIVTSADFGLFGVLLFIMAYSFFVSSRYARAYSRLEQFSRPGNDHGRQKLLADVTNMFDSLEQAVIALDADRKICFCNQAFSQLTGFACASLKQRLFSDLLEAPENQVSEALLEALGGKGPASGKADVFQEVRLTCQGKSLSANLLFTTFELSGAPLLLVLVRKPEKPGADLKQTKEKGHTVPVSANMLRDLNANRERILQLEKAVLSQDINGGQEPRAVLDDLKALDDLLSRLGTLLSAKDTSGEKRHQAVAVMNLALDCWSAAGHGGKVELAEQSRIWNVYLEKDGYFRTQTLDKYLAIKTLPSRPRWRDIHATAEFVLDHCDADTPPCRQLAQELAKLKSFS